MVNSQLRIGRQVLRKTRCGWPDGLAMDKLTPLDIILMSDDVDSCLKVCDFYWKDLKCDGFV